MDEDKPGWCEALYNAKAAELLLYGRALGLSHSQAEDVVHETFVAMLRRAEAPSQPVHYCIRAFRNRALRFRQRFWRRLVLEFESQRWFEPSTEETLAEREAMRLLAELPTDQREVIVLKIWHEHTFEQIGELLNISPNTAAGRYRYGLQKVKRGMKGTVYERDERIGAAIACLGAAPPVGES